MDLRVQLKVCEGCGCLWYRLQAETRVYCAACNQRFQEFPTPESRKRRGRPKKITLPAVFAVQDPAEVEEEEEFGATGTGRLWVGKAFDRPNETAGVAPPPRFFSQVAGPAAFAGGAF